MEERLLVMHSGLLLYHQLLSIWECWGKRKCAATSILKGVFL